MKKRTWTIGLVIMAVLSVFVIIAIWETGLNQKLITVSVDLSPTSSPTEHQLPENHVADLVSDGKASELFCYTNEFYNNVTLLPIGNCNRLRKAKVMKSSFYKQELFERFIDEEKCMTRTPPMSHQAKTWKCRKP